MNDAARLEAHLVGVVRRPPRWYPLAVAVLIPPARRALDWLAGLSGRIPRWTGIVLIALGIWSIWFGLFVTPRP